MERATERVGGGVRAAGESIGWDLRMAARRLRRGRASSAMVVGTLALGIAATTAAFSVLSGVVLDALPFRDPDRLVVVWGDLRREQNPRFSVSWENFRDLREQATVFESVAAQMGWGVTMTGAGDPEAVRGVQVSGGYFGVLGVDAALGRALVPADEASGRRVVVLGAGLWRRRFAADPGVLGRVVRLGGEPYEVVGVLPPEVRVPPFFRAPHEDAEFWIPLDLPPEMRHRAAAVLQVVGRLAAGRTEAEARRELAAIARGLERAHPATNTGMGFGLVPLDEQLTGEARPILLILWLATVVLLLIAVANVANLLLVRAMGRRREMAVLAAVGAGRGRLVRVALFECLLLALAAGAIGTLLAAWGLDALVRVAPPETPRLDTVGVDARVVGFALAATLLAALAAVVPVLRGSRVPLREALAAGSEGARGGGAGPAGVLVVGQVATAFALLAAAGLLGRTYQAMRAVDPGFRAEGVATFRLFLPPARYPDPAARHAFFRDFFDRASALPGVVSAGGTTRFPLDPSYGFAAVRIEGDMVAEGEEPLVGLRTVAGDYFAALRIPLRRGRLLGPDDDGDAPPVALINEAMARRFLAGRDPVGARIEFAGYPGEPLEVVGVVGSVSDDGVRSGPIPEMYLSAAQAEETGFNVVVRGTGGRTPAIAPIRDLVASMDPELAIVDPMPMADRVAAATARPRFAMLLLGLVSAASVLLATVGLFGLLSFTVRGRRREIAIRMALGARPGHIVRLVMREGTRRVGAGLLLGLALTLPSGRLLAPELFRVAPNDPATLALSAAAVLVAAVLAWWGPARWAARVAPMAAMKAE